MNPLAQLSSSFPCPPQLQAEVDRLNELKRQNMSRFVEATRAELHKIWDLCFYGTEQRREFAPAFSGEQTQLSSFAPLE